MGRSRGLEPPTSGTTNRRSNQLSYDRHISALYGNPQAAAKTRISRACTQQDRSKRARACCTMRPVMEAKTVTNPTRRNNVSHIANLA